MCKQRHDKWLRVFCDYSATANRPSLDASQAGHAYFIPAYLCAGLPGPIVLRTRFTNGPELYLEELKAQLWPTQSALVLD